MSEKCNLRGTTVGVRVMRMGMSWTRFGMIFINLGPISIAQFCFFILFLLYHFSCKMKIGNRIVKDLDEVV